MYFVESCCVNLWAPSNSASKQTAKIGECQFECYQGGNYQKKPSRAVVRPSLNITVTSSWFLYADVMGAIDIGFAKIGRVWVLR
jgi:hypothetical protein